MNKPDNAYFLEAFETITAGLYTSPGSAHNCGECCCDDTDESIQLADEGSFSWSPCDTCGNRLGGNRYHAHGWPTDEIPSEGNLYHFDVCEDCLMFMANGDLPEIWSAGV
jgi:hypothetical protein